MRLLLVAAVLWCGCDQDMGVDDDRPDFAFSYDMSVAGPDLAMPMCPRQFTGFAGVSDVERRVDCACGCSVDTLLGNMVGGFWATPTSSAAGRVVPVQGVGLEVDIDTSTSFESAGIVSTPPVAPFYLDGDFTIAVDYQLLSFANDARAMLTLGSPTHSYTVERERTAPGDQLATAIFNGVSPTSRSDSAATGTLQLERTGTTVIATANGVPITQIISAGTERLSLFLGAARGACTPNSDGGVCTVAVLFKSVRMMGGSLVDRR